MADIPQQSGQMKEDLFYGRTEGLAEKAKALSKEIENYAPEAERLYQKLVAGE